MNSKFKKLIKNTGILAIGTFGSKVLSFLIVPFYTYILTTSEYGTIDLFTTAIGLMIPFVTFQIQESLIRYAVGKEYSTQVLLNNCLVILMFGIIVSTLLIPIYYFLLPGYALLYYFYLITSAFVNIFSHYLRVIEKNLEYSVNGVLLTLVTITLNLIFLLILKLGIKGYIYSLIIAQLASCLYIIISGKLFEQIDFNCIDKEIIKKMLRYSIPLIPNTLMWWIMNAGDKFIINYCLGVDANGIYALSMKIPTIIQLLYSIFTMAWQISAIETMTNDEVRNYYNDVLQYISLLLSIGTGIIIVLVKPVFIHLMDPSYIVAWKYVSFLCISMIFSCYSSFFGVFYNVYKVNRKVLSTTVIGALSNLISNIVLVRLFGLYGVAFGTIIGFCIMTIIRNNDASYLIGAKIHIKKCIISTIILFVESVIMIVLNEFYCYLCSVFCILLIIVLYYKELHLILNRILKGINRV